MNTYIYEVLQAKERLKVEGKFQLPRTVEERSATSLRLMEAADIPKFNWTIDSESGDISLQSEVEPNSVHVYHASTCNTQVRPQPDISLVVKHHFYHRGETSAS